MRDAEEAHRNARMYLYDLFIRVNKGSFKGEEIFHFEDDMKRMREKYVREEAPVAGAGDEK